jgi:hypothetical protein
MPHFRAKKGTIATAAPTIVEDFELASDDLVVTIELRSRVNMRGRLTDHTANGATHDGSTRAADSSDRSGNAGNDEVARNRLGGARAAAAHGAPHGDDVQVADLATSADLFLRMDKHEPCARCI